MGDKAQARAMAKQAGVPVVPGSDGPLEGVDEAQALADTIGYPVMIKAAAGGGGRGMRIVRARDDARPGLRHAARRRPAQAFGDLGALPREVRRGAAPRRGADPGRPERHPRAPGRARLLGAAPAPEAPRGDAPPRPSPTETRARPLQGRAHRRQRASTTCRRARSSSSWRATARFYFIEMNTRIQVEHPVTEMVTGIDLVQRADPHRRGRAARLQAGRRRSSAATPSSAASTPRIRSTSCPRPGTVDGVAAARGPRRARRQPPHAGSGRAAVLRLADRQDHRPRPRPRRGHRPHAAGARRDASWKASRPPSPTTRSSWPTPPSSPESTAAPSRSRPLTAAATVTLPTPLYVILDRGSRRRAGSRPTLSTPCSRAAAASSSCARRPCRSATLYPARARAPAPLPGGGLSLHRQRPRGPGPGRRGRRRPRGAGRPAGARGATAPAPGHDPRRLDPRREPGAPRAGRRRRLRRGRQHVSPRAASPASSSSARISSGACARRSRCRSSPSEASPWTMSRRSSGPAPTPSPSSRPSAPLPIPRRPRGASSRRFARPARAPPGERHTAGRRSRSVLLPAAVFAIAFVTFLPGLSGRLAQLGRRRQLSPEPRLPRARLGEPALDVHHDPPGALDPAHVADPGRQLRARRHERRGAITWSTWCSTRRTPCCSTSPRAG